MQLDNQDERVQTAFHDISHSMKLLVDGHVVFNEGLIRVMKSIIRDHADRFRREHGYDFPPLGLFVLPSVKFIVCVRQDLEEEDIQRRLVIWIRQFQKLGVNLTAQEVAQATIRCWPNYLAPIEDLREDPKLQPGTLH